VHVSKIVLLLLALLARAAFAAPDWKMQPSPLATRWAASVNPSNVWPEYPRPQLVRPHWQNLNGLWEYAITARDAPAPTQYAGRILVPYPLESALSGVKQPLQPDQRLWYRRTLHFAPAHAGERVLLHFGAVDYEATVLVNDQVLGTHSGGYQSFTFEITDALKAGDNSLVVGVYDPTEQGPNPRGKQHRHGQWMNYAPSSGIWQTVWLERVPATYIERLTLTPDVDRSELRVEVGLEGNTQGYTTEVVARSGAKVIVRQTIHQSSTALSIGEPRLWSPDDPYLYDLEVRLLKNGRVVDEVKSYFGMRKIELRRDDAGRARIYLNGRYTYNLTVVDQGYWPDGLYTAPSDAALRFDVQAAKALGFNTIRKHVKVEPQRWYYHCDKLGLLVWQDMPTSSNATPEARQQFEREIQQNIDQLHNHPSITTWVLFNEGWGAYDPARLAQRLKQADPTRLVDGHSGPFDHVKYSQWRKRLEPKWLLRSLGGASRSLDDFMALQYEAPADWIGGDMIDLHYYPGPKMFPARADVASVAGEYGSYGVYVEGHVWDELQPVGRGVGGSGMSPQQMLKTFAEAAQQLKALEAQGLSGSAYFEIVDVEFEQQGFLTYDRAIAKVPIAEIERLNAQLVPRAANYAAATKGFSIANADWAPESQRYAGLVTEFRKGRRELSFLRRLALMALRQKDQAQATAAGDEYIARLPMPYVRETWEAVLAITQTTRDRGFKLLYTRVAEVDAALGAQTAEKKILEIIQRDVIAPYFKQQQRPQSWEDFERSVATEYGDLGREAVRGAQMMEQLVNEDWAGFGNAYVRYYETAIPRSLYLLHNVTYRVLAHVSDPNAVATAIRAMQWLLDMPREDPVFGRYDPTELDTYANLLYKAGRVAEALAWQERAVAASFGRDPEIVANLQRMKSDSASSVRTAPGR
jgi:hypothetical protein